MEFRQLEYFVMVAQELHFGRAAERLHIVQPAVSQQVRRLERELGIELFDRSSRHVRLTADGERMLVEARAVLDAADRATAVAAQLANGRAGVIRLGASPGFETRVASAVTRLRTEAPDLDVRLDARPAAAQVDAVRSGELDLAVLRAFPGQPGLHAVEVWHDEAAVVLNADHPLARHDAVALDQLADMPLRLPARDCDPFVHDVVLGACRAAGFEPELGRPAGRAYDTMLEIGNGPPVWTVLVGAVGEIPAGVRVLPLRPRLQVPAVLVLKDSRTPACVEALTAVFTD